MKGQEEITILDTSGATEVTVEKIKTSYKLAPQMDSWRLTEELVNLGGKIDALNINIEHLTRLMNPPVQQLLVEPINFDQAKEVVSSYMRDHRTASISELAEQLQIDLRMLCKVIEELRKEGHIKERE